jgi:hypothetical protein
MLLVKSKALWLKAASVDATRSATAEPATRAAKPIAVRLAPLITETSIPKPAAAQQPRCSIITEASTAGEQISRDRLRMRTARQFLNSGRSTAKSAAKSMKT